MIEWMSELRWNLVNLFVRIWFNIMKSIGFPKWNQVSEPEGWILDKKDDFDIIDPQAWHVTELGNWGSARPDNLSCATVENVTAENSVLTIVSKKQTAVGKDWEGNPVERNYTCGSIDSKFSMLMHTGLFRAKVRVQKDLGSWKAYWIFKNYGKRYQEIDAFEQFASSRENLSRWSTTVHWGRDGEHRQMYGKGVDLYNNGDWLIFDIYVDQEKKRIKVKINGVTAYISGLGLPHCSDQMQVIFSDSVCDHKGKVSIDQIETALPYKFEVDYFKLYRKIED